MKQNLVVRIALSEAEIGLELTVADDLLYKMLSEKISNNWNLLNSALYLLLEKQKIVIFDCSLQLSTVVGRMFELNTSLNYGRWEGERLTDEINFEELCSEKSNFYRRVRYRN